MGARGAVVAVFLLAIVPGAGAEGPSLPSPGSGVLVEASATWDGQTVAFTGEAIGEAMGRGPMAWIHLNDDPYGLSEAGKLAGYNSGIGVWVDAHLVSRISTFGDYGHHGDVVEVVGTFHAACPEHGGDLDIHAASLRIASAGHGTPHPVAARRAVAAGIMAALSAALFVGVRVQRRRARRGR